MPLQERAWPNSVRARNLEHLVRTSGDEEIEKREKKAALYLARELERLEQEQAEHKSSTDNDTVTTVNDSSPKDNDTTMQIAVQEMDKDMQSKRVPHVGYLTF